MKRPVDYRDIQGLAAFGYAKLTQASYFLAEIRDAGAARDWLLAAPVASAEYKDPPPDTAMQIGFTSQGLRALGVAETIVRGFSPEFVSGMAGETNRSRRLGDTGENDPERWYWGGPKNVPDIVVMLFARQDLGDFKRQVLNELWDRGFANVTCLSTSDMGGFEPFGFRDGINQPEIDWKQEIPVTGDRIDFSNTVALGEFLLGYVNEYGKYTDRPLVHAEADRGGDLPDAEDTAGKKDVGRNGTYLVLRQLEQDVPGFWKFLDEQTGGNVSERDKLGAAMVGRARDGEPLAAPSAEAIPGMRLDPQKPLNSFTFDGDPKGTRCPFGAHIRRANPRNADLSGKPQWFLTRLANKLGIPRAEFGEDLMASTRFHRILRRGREYGSWLAPEDALKISLADDSPRGLQFACLNANISRQFEFVQSAWLMSAKFNGLTGEADPLLGNDNRNFSIPQAGGLRRLVTGMPQFITVRGGAYFFLPGLGALRFLARGGRR
jgi:deferrochelatase/peroxidase EfeB